MTPDEKLNHLRDWLSCWIDARVSRLKAIDMVFFMLREYGILIDQRGVDINVVPFEEYLQLISNTKQST